MSSATDAYQQALRNYKSAEASATEMARLIRSMADCTRGDMFSSFLGWHCGISQISHGGRYDPKANLKMDDWPDSSRVKDTFKSWGVSLEQLKAAWGALSADEKIGFTEPPTKLAAAY